MRILSHFQLVMKKRLAKNGKLLTLLFLIYSILSFLIFLRDDFLLERIAFLTNSPNLLKFGRVIGKTLHVNSIPTLLYFLVILLMFVVYFKTLRLVKKTNFKNTYSSLIINYSLIFMLISLISFPALSTDVFDYISSNRVLFVHKANPWLVAPQNFPNDEFIYLGSWKFRPSVYGPVQFIFSSLVQAVAGNNLIANIIGFKLTGAVFTVSLIVLFKKFVLKHFPDQLLFSLALFSWNPLLHIEILANAHNDVIMAFFAFLGLVFFYQKKLVRSALALALAVLAKIAAVLFIPIIAIYLISKNKSKAFLFITAFTIFTSLGFLTLGRGFKGLIENLGVQLGLYLRSLPTIFRFIFLRLQFSPTRALILEKALTIPAFILLFIFYLKKVKAKSILITMVITMMIYLMLVSPMLQPWYLVWILPFVALLKPGRIQNVALVFSASCLLYYSVLFTSFYFSPLHFGWQITMLAVMVIPPLSVWIMPLRWYTQIKRKLLV